MGAGKTEMGYDEDEEDEESATFGSEHVAVLGGCDGRGCVFGIRGVW